MAESEPTRADRRLQRDSAGVAVIRFGDVIVFFWVACEADKQALIQDPATPSFTGWHFDGHPSVLLRAAQVGELSRAELTELVRDGWRHAPWHAAARSGRAPMACGGRSFRPSRVCHGGHDGARR
jgi:hypothetical protein